jgi:hypothetical protein
LNLRCGKVNGGSQESNGLAEQATFLVEPRYMFLHGDTHALENVSNVGEQTSRPVPGAGDVHPDDSDRVPSIDHGCPGIPAFGNAIVFHQLDEIYAGIVRQFVVNDAG